MDEMGWDKEKELLDLYRTRVRDREKSRTRRRKACEAHPSRLSTLLTQYFKKDSQALSKIEETRALFAWEEYVGPAAARLSRALRVRNQTLVVKVEDPLWMQQLSFLKRDLLRRYAEDFPRLRLKDIFFTR